MFEFWVCGAKSRYKNVAGPYLVGQVEVEVDFLAEMHVGEEMFILHPDFQTRYDPAMPTRMHEYRVHIRCTYGKPVLSVVVWLTAERYPGRGHNRLEEVVLGRRQLVFEFEEVRLWELDPEKYLAQGQRREEFSAQLAGANVAGSPV